VILAGPIYRLEDWYCKAGPKDPRIQWEDGHSAKEFATFIMDHNGISLLDHLIDEILPNHNDLFAVPELVTRLDKYLGEHRNHDFALYSKNRQQDLITCVEAKATERLDVLVGKKWEEGNKKGSNIQKRINDMSSKLWNGNVSIEKIKTFRYQLLTGLVGSVIQAEGLWADNVLFLVLQLRTRKVSSKHIMENKGDFTEFLNSFETMQQVTISNSCTFGPLEIQSDVKTYIGYLEVDMENLSAATGR
jgi:Domain of unknown function (DUF6946)